MIPGQELEYLGRPYMIPIEGDEPRQMNAAAAAGIAARAILNPDFSAGGLYGDTLRAELDLQKLETVQGRSTFELVRAARAAVVQNACRSANRSPEASFLEIRIFRRDGVEAISEVYPLRPFKNILDDTTLDLDD